MTDNEKLIEEARRAYLDAWAATNLEEVPPGTRSRNGIIAALAVFEKAHTPTPPDGWFYIGSHVGAPWLNLEFSEEVDETGLPLWERPVQHAPTDQDSRNTRRARGECGNAECGQGYAHSGPCAPTDDEREELSQEVLDLAVKTRDKADRWANVLGEIALGDEAYAEAELLKKASEAIRRSAVPEPSADTGCSHDACEIDAAGIPTRCADCGDDLAAVPEPSAEHFHIWSDPPCRPGECRMEPQGERFADHSERYAPKRPKEPQGEPTDEAVDAARGALPQFTLITREHMRAALRAAAEVTP